MEQARYSGQTRLRSTSVGADLGRCLGAMRDLSLVRFLLSEAE